MSKLKQGMVEARFDARYSMKTEPCCGVREGPLFLFTMDKKNRLATRLEVYMTTGT